MDLMEVQPGTSAHGHSMDHLCLAVVDFDLDQIRAGLLAQGVSVGESGRRFGAAGWGPSIYLSDPDGNGLELR